MKEKPSANHIIIKHFVQCGTDKINKRMDVKINMINGRIKREHDEKVGPGYCYM